MPDRKPLREQLDPEPVEYVPLDPELEALLADPESREYMISDERYKLGRTRRERKMRRAVTNLVSQSYNPGMIAPEVGDWPDDFLEEDEDDEG